MKQLIACCIGLMMLTAVSAQKIQYKVSFPNAVHHEAHIEVTASGLPAGKPAVFLMSRSSPGRYATHEFGKNVYDVTAYDNTGKAIRINRVDGDIYEVPAHKGAVTVSYTLFANYPDGTYAGIDPESIHLNMPACFMWVKGMENAPIEIRFALPKENKGIVATQLVPVAGKSDTYSAPGLQYFMDSPTKIGDLIMREWKVSNPGGQTFTIRIALEAAATERQADELADNVKKIVEEARAVFGEFPVYDHGSYTFIASANPYVFGDGMEHRNATMISSTMSVFSPARLLGVFSHEYFHNWNVERIRPKTLEPFNFAKSNMSHELWFAEGFTQYYGNLLLARAGLTEEKNYLLTAGGLVNAKMNTPGATYYSPVDASNHAVFVDAAVSIDRNNYANMFSSYYTYGAAIALALDLEMQVRYHKTLDAFMRAMWQKFGKKEIPYTLAGMQDALASVTDAAFAAKFFSSYITGHEPVDYASLLAKGGYDLKKINEGRPAIGFSLSSADPNRAIIANGTIRGSAAYIAGLDINDEIIKLDGTAVKNNTDLGNFLQNKKTGDAVTVTYKHRGIEKTTSLVLKEQPMIMLVDRGSADEAAKHIRSSWFSTQVKK
ncbi:M61 family metallopeptidase [Sediminibacterium soli]|uniref:M61 family metallopeptidase n=1 Tax=Sediminibacterium soli TaxID=2698829 RepID=UPI00137A7F6E|nr:PDZ domain-containing protein [Sediminibacterium soli]NCI45985.1 M61 family metallopeptidase [Sediminibacterium soli]